MGTLVAVGLSRPATLAGSNADNGFRDGCTGAVRFRHLLVLMGCGPLSATRCWRYLLDMSHAWHT